MVKKIVKKVITLSLLSSLISVTSMLPTKNIAFAESSIVQGDLASSFILSEENAILQNYSIEDLKATKAFILNAPYDGNGHVTDANEDGRIDAFDMVLLRRDYQEAGNYYNLLKKMVDKHDVECSIMTSDGIKHTNRIVVRTDEKYDFSEYSPVAVLSNDENKHIIQFDSLESSEKCLKDLQGKEHIIYAEEDYYCDAGDLIDDGTDFSLASESNFLSSNYNSWGVEKIEADKYSKYLAENYNNHITVAVVDSGTAKHSFLNSRTINGYDVVNNDNDPSDDTLGHGTHVSGIIADCTRNLNIDIMPIKVFNTGYESMYIADGIDWAVNLGADVINLSLRVPYISNDIEYSVTRAIQSGITVVIASGNDGQDNSYCSPPRMTQPIVVASINNSYNRAKSSNYGRSVDVSAPGVNVYSTVPSGYDYMSGTSMAAPHIAAAAAMIKYSGIATTPAQIESTLTGTCQDLGITGYDVYYGYGIPKLSKLIKSTVQPTISLSAKSATLYKGQKYTLSASVTPGDVDVKWTTSDSSVATVSNGVVTANSEGTATITAFFTYNGTNYSATCNITVKKPGITLSESSKTVYQTNTFKLNADTLPTNQTVFWSTSNNSVATVSNGNVTAVNPGTATITAAFTYAGETYSASCNVTVKEVSVKLNQTSKTVYQTDEFTLNATIIPVGQTISWSSSNSNVAKVSDGKVTAINPGTATITASFVYGGKTFSASCSVTVKKVSIELSTHSKSLIIGDTSAINATTSPGGLVVSWESTNNMVASVSSGKITAKAPGSITIKATMTYNGKEYLDSCSVTVVEPSVKLSKSQVKISKNETFKLSGETLPSGQTITWKSENTNICSIDSNGTITGKNTGNTMVYATITYGGVSYKTSCNVIVGEPKVTLNKSSMSMYVSDTQSLIASVIAVDGIDISSETRSDITWTSNNTGVATVSSNGSVSAISTGEAIITATYTFCGVKYTATCTVNVNGKPGITLNLSSKSMYIGDTYTLIESVTPSNSIVTWSSSNSSVATVNSNGKVTAISNGTATITASIRYNGVTYYADCIFTVNKPSITFDVTSKSLYQGDSFVIYETVKPSGYNVTWSSSNSSVASVSSNGTVTAKNAGTATITGKFTYGGNTYSATCKVTVNSLSLSLSSYSGSSTYDVANGTSYLTDGSACGYSFNLPSASYTSGCSMSWSVVSGSAKIINSSTKLFIMQPGTVTARCTISRNGYSISKDYTFSLSLIKTTSAGNYFYQYCPSYVGQTDYRYSFAVPKGVTVYYNELRMIGNAAVSGGALYGKIIYNGYEGWIIVCQW